MWGESQLVADFWSFKTVPDVSCGEHVSPVLGGGGEGLDDKVGTKRHISDQTIPSKRETNFDVTRTFFQRDSLSILIILQRRNIFLSPS